MGCRPGASTGWPEKTRLYIRTFTQRSRSPEERGSGWQGGKRSEQRHIDLDSASWINHWTRALGKAGAVPGIQSMQLFFFCRVIKGQICRSVILQSGNFLERPNVITGLKGNRSKHDTSLTNTLKCQECVTARRCPSCSRYGHFALYVHPAYVVSNG